MKALTWHGKSDIRCEQVDDPTIEDDRDVMRICGSDLHLMGGFVPEMHAHDMLGHETMSEVVEVGKGHSKFKIGERVVVPFTISCGGARCASGRCSRYANGRIQSAPSRQNRLDIQPLACSAIRICMAASRAARPNSCAYLMPMLARSRCQIA